MKSASEKTAALERQAFSDRLRRAIADFDESLLSPTVLAREFNRRSRHSTIGTTAAYKWLSGEAIPQQEKLSFLATWLRVSVQWLRYGAVADDSEAGAVVGNKERRRQDKLLSDFGALGERDKALIENLIQAMLHNQSS
ncbi:hypothetical protein [Noviherbaspirillum sedimenti]|uniref:Transcriptional regulator n=1 Tax=Noviherbaspirillum sedimenti TaxID=2320865 RepID=A0A3A3G4Q4_9BURK|nr:hypothetical protein [Noviherbaspirillum sedimenti]RJG02645.1 hypothetical protein D3878_14550 [Noviherbaspirillum sedimenti]